MSRNVLLTGATGFVGRQVLQILLQRGQQVRLVIRPDKQPPSEAAGRIEVPLITPDLFKEEASWWEEACRGVDTVIHLAWYAEPGKYLESSLNLDCLSGTLEIARGAARAGVRRWIGCGSCFEYDLRAGLLTTDTPLRPLTAYAAAKAAAFLALERWLPLQGVEFAWCRLFYLYGEGEDARRLVPYIRARLSAGEPAELTHGTQVRDYLEVREAARQIVACALGNARGAVNICSGVAITVRALAEQIADEYGRRDLLHFGARPDNLTDPARVLGQKTELRA
jgi:dTDP-6-deoxy-L-talose 4-dehydrogenase (NAD+)